MDGIVQALGCREEVCVPVEHQPSRSNAGGDEVPKERVWRLCHAAGFGGADIPDHPAVQGLAGT